MVDLDGRWSSLVGMHRGRYMSGLAEHGRISLMDGIVVAESFQTRLTETR